MANSKLNTKEHFVAFHNEMNDLLNKYDLLPEDGKFHLITSKMNYLTNNLNCKPECIMTKVVTLPNGHTTLLTFCDPDCE